jgi:hypothetical protein
MIIAGQSADGEMSVQQAIPVITAKRISLSHASLSKSQRWHLNCILHDQLLTLGLSMRPKDLLYILVLLILYPSTDSFRSKMKVSPSDDSHGAYETEYFPLSLQYRPQRPLKLAKLWISGCITSSLKSGLTASALNHSAESPVSVMSGHYLLYLLMSLQR